MGMLITGASGFIGSNLVEELLKKEELIVGIDKDMKAKHRLENVIPKNSELSSFSTNFVTKYFRMIWDDVNSIMNYHYSFDNVDTVYHLAAFSDIKGSMENPVVDFENNIKGTHSILELMRKKDIKNIIFTSTSALYGENPPTPTPEISLPDPISLYSASKISSEAMINAYAETYGMKGWIFRFGNVVGRNQHRGVIYDFINKLKRDNQKLEILGDGKQVKSYIHVSDCVNAMLEIPNNGIKDGTEIYNIATYDQLNVTKVADLVCDVLDMKPKYSYTGGDRGWKGDIPRIILNIDKALMTGWKPKYHCKQAVKKATKELK